MVTHLELLGLAGMLLVFASFIVKRWVWLYALNLSGTVTLTVYAYLRGDPIFTVVEAGIAFFLAYRLGGEVLSSRRGRSPRDNSESRE
ncbi:MAG: hypothetical protein LRS46_01940 [Desulfurococcales archaeon]|nr:hypothetical protein [Desulfurococcales archaeon]